jgi:hypothetical protein
VLTCAGMGSLRARWVMALMGSAVVLLATALIAPQARACGGFFSRKASEGQRRPALAYEQALIVFDAERKREHFIREVAFRTAGEAFGFVVPTPARPEVAAVKNSPFARLRADFPFEAPSPSRGRGLGALGGGAGSGKGAGVTVLEVAKVGSFTAFVLAASDERALGNWLAQNGFASTSETDAWLAHYVRAKFYYVAMRYTPVKGASKEVNASETMRISFDTPLPYYPYFEPRPAANRAASDPRLLEVWLIAQEVYVPIAARQKDDSVEWVRPFATGAKYGTRPEQLRSVLAAEADLVPRSEAGGARTGVLRFMDQKRSRLGFGDVVFVPANKHILDAEARARLLPLLHILDPRLLEGR